MLSQQLSSSLSMIFKIPGLTWKIVSLSPMICIKSLPSSAQSDQTRLTRTAHDVFIRVFCSIRDAFLFSSSLSSTIPIILRSAEVNLGSVCVSHAKLRFQYFLRKTILCQKKLFVAVHELHDNMKAWTDLLNNRTRR